MTVRSEGLDGRMSAARRRGDKLPPPIDDIPGLADLAPGADPGSNAAIDEWFGPVADADNGWFAPAARAPDSSLADSSLAEDDWVEERWFEDDWVEDDWVEERWSEDDWVEGEDVWVEPEPSPPPVPAVRADAWADEHEIPDAWAEEWPPDADLHDRGHAEPMELVDDHPYDDGYHRPRPVAEHVAEHVAEPELPGAFAAAGPDGGFPHEPMGGADDIDEQPGKQRWVRFVSPVALIMAVVIIVSLLTGYNGQQITTPDNPTPAPLEVDTVPSITLPRAAMGDEGEGEVGPTTTAVGLLEARELPFVDTDPNTFWVGPSGDEGNDGQTPDTPWASLQGALDRVQPGQTIYLMTGNYTELHERQAHYVIERGGTADAWVTITAGPGHQPVILATVGNGISVRANYVEVSGIEMRGEGFSADNPYGWGVLVRDAHHVRVVDNVVSAMPVGGIGSVGASNLVFADNEVFENSFWGTEQGSGISIWNARDRGTEPDENGYHNVISGNIIYRNENKVPSRFRNNGSITDGNGIIVDQNDPTGYTGRTLVANNVIFDNGGRAILVLESSRVDVYHNTTYHNGRTGALEGGPVELAAGRANDVRFFNNLSWALPGAPALRYNTSNGIVTGGNVLVSTNQDAYASDQDRVTTADPGLTAPGLDPATANFHPAVGSTATQVGLGLDTPIPVDADGAARPSPGAVGALEPAEAGGVDGN